MKAIPRKLKKNGISYDGFVPSLTERQIMNATDKYIGFCLRCGKTRPNCEPDARHYDCYKCKEWAVYAIPELLTMGLVELK